MKHDATGCDQCNVHGPHLTTTQYDFQAFHRAFHNLIEVAVLHSVRAGVTYLAQRIERINKS